MKENDHGLQIFLLLAAVALLIQYTDIPMFTGELSTKDGAKLLTGNAKVRLADYLSGNSSDHWEMGKIDGNVSPCGVSPRLALLRFQPFDLNRADPETLNFIRGVGMTLASRIIAKREEMGGFSEVDDLLTVRGIGPSKLKAVKEVAAVCR